MFTQDRLLATSKLVVGVVWFVNRALCLAITLGLLLSWIFNRPFTQWVESGALEPGMHPAAAGMRWLMVIGILGFAGSDRILVALRQMMATVSVGDPFVLENSRRLQRIGWVLLGLQLLDIPSGFLGKIYPSMGSIAPSDTFSFVGWISVLMVFVLSRVFAAGSAMREELEATV